VGVSALAADLKPTRARHRASYRRNRYLPPPAPRHSAMDWRRATAKKSSLAGVDMWWACARVDCQRSNRPQELGSSRASARPLRRDMRPSLTSCAPNGRGVTSQCACSNCNLMQGAGVQCFDAALRAGLRLAGAEAARRVLAMPLRCRAHAGVSGGMCAASDNSSGGHECASACHGSGDPA